MLLQRAQDPGDNSSGFHFQDEPSENLPPAEHFSLNMKIIWGCWALVKL
jgi:hypothetical protein